MTTSLPRRKTLPILLAILAMGWLATATAFAATPDWVPNKAYAVKALASYAGRVYEARQAHTSQVGQEPPNAAALWLVFVEDKATSAWEVQRLYGLDEKTLYQGRLYQCLQSHVSQPDWAPPVVPALWKPVTKVAVPDTHPFATQLYKSGGSNTTDVFLPLDYYQGSFLLSQASSFPDWSRFEEGVRRQEAGGTLPLLITQEKFTAQISGKAPADKTFFMASFSKPTGVSQNVSVVTSQAFFLTRDLVTKVQLIVEGVTVTLPLDGKTSLHFSSEGEKTITAQVTFDDGVVRRNKFKYVVDSTAN